MIPDGTGIYAVENVYSRWVYVGCTKHRFTHRWHAHLAAFRSGKHWNPLVREDAERYGACSFRFIILQPLPRLIPYVTFERFWHQYLLALGVSCYNVHAETESVIFKDYVPRLPPGYRYRPRDIGQRCRPRLDTDTVSWLRKKGVIQGIRCASGWYFERGAIEQLNDYAERQRAAKRKIPYGLDASVS